jgi:hypothetical protein
MKTIKLTIIGMNLLADGGAAILTKPSKENPSANGVHKVNAKQLANICVRATGFNSPIALKQAIAVSNGSAELSIQAEIIKAGDVWENKVTGETGVHKGSTKPGFEGQPYTKYSNHEIELGFAASMKLLEIAATAGINNAATFVQTAPVRTANKSFGIAATDAVNAPETQEQEEA